LIKTSRYLQVVSISVFVGEDNTSFTSSEQTGLTHPTDQSDGSNMPSLTSDLFEAEHLANQEREISAYEEREIPPPQPMELEVLVAEERKRALVSSYENVYTGVPLEPSVNRMSMDASEMQIGDKFDTKQSDNKLASGLSSSYEKLYEKAADDDEAEGECKSESSASVVVDVRASKAHVDSSSFSSSHNAPVYITVESGLDKLACGSETQTKQESLRMHHSSVSHASYGTKVKDISTRSSSCDGAEGLDDDVDQLMRPKSTPDLSSPVDPNSSQLPAGR